jgi:endonuclease/exonuclease/phosphatase family metal-dependent hydrolase
MEDSAMGNSWRKLADRQVLVGFMLPALVITMGLQTLRVFFPSLAWYLKDTVGLPSTTLAICALATFAVGFLSPLVWSALGGRRALQLTAGGVVVLRLAEQLSRTPAVDLGLSLAGTAMLGLFLPLWVGQLRTYSSPDGGPRWVFGLWLGFALDTAIKGANASLDLSWSSSLWATLVTVGLAAVALWSLNREPASIERPPCETDWRSALSLIGLGPLLLIELLVFQNLGWTAEVAGISEPVAFVLLGVGNFLAVAGALWGFSRPYAFRWLPVLAAGIYLVFGFTAADEPGLGFMAILLIGQFLLGWMSALIATVTRVPSRYGLLPTGVSLTIGMILFALLAFLYYATMDLNLGIPRGFIPPLAAGLFVMAAIGAVGSSQGKLETPWSEFSPLTASALLILIPLVALGVFGRAPQATPPSPGPVTVMNYNIHSAFAADGRQDPEAIARAIKASGADIVCINEISRGWLIDGSTDLAFWLSHRLGMPIVFKGTADPIWGNAILSRDPIVQTGTGSLPLSHALISRGFIWARIDTGGPQPWLVISTHLHQLEGDHDIRLLQVPVLVDLWSGQPDSLILGDMNAQPGDPEMNLFRDSGLVDSWSEAGKGDGFTFSSTDPFERIDWIWHSPDLHAVAAEVPVTAASDHRPLVVTLDRAP